MGVPLSRPVARPKPYTSEEDLISGSMLMGIPHVCSNLRIPFEGADVHQQGTGCVGYVGDVNAAVNTTGQVQTSQVSVLPKSRSPRSARSRAPSTLSRIHLILGPEK